jgi:hypothetical protein
MRFVLVAGLIAAALQGQQAVDFLQVMTGYTEQQADSLVTSTLRNLGFTITRNSPNAIEATEDGGKVWGSGKIERTIYATVTVGDSTGIHLTAQEIRYDRHGGISKRKRLSNKEGGDNGKFWQRVTTAARLMDSTAHSATYSAGR